MEVSFPIKAGVTNPEAYPGPYTVVVEVSSECGDVNLCYNNKEGVNTLTFTTYNPQVLIEAIVDGNGCDVLADVNVTFSNKDCTAVSSTTIANPCASSFVQIKSGLVSNDEQKFTAAPNGMSSISNYIWQVIGSANIKSGQGTKCVVIDRSNQEAFQLVLEVEDSNGCSKETTSNVPAISVDSFIPSLAGQSFSRLCSEPSQFVYSLLQNGNDPDGYLDYTTIEVLSGPSNGTTVIDTINGTVTYTPNTGALGIDTFQVRVRDNTGNYSNAALVSVQNTCIDEDPGTNPDVATTSCGEDVFVNVLDNDNNVNESTLAISTQGVKGVAQVLSGGQIKYTPNDGASGADVFYYTVFSPEGVSEVQSVNVFIRECCDDYSANLQFRCEPEGTDAVKITAIPQGSAQNLSSDVIDNNISGGDTAIINQSSITTVKQIGATDVNMNVEVFSSFLSGSKISIVFTGSSVQAVSELATFIQNCEGVIQIGSSDLFSYPSTFLSSHISNIQANSNELCFNYASGSILDSGSILTAEVSNTISLIKLIAFNSDQDYLDIGNTANIDTRCYTNNNSEDAIFTRTMQRPNCPDIELRYKLTISDVTDCDTLTVALISGSEGNGANGTTDIASYHAKCDNSPTILSSLIVDGVNILDRVYQTSEIAALSVFLNTYLASNGGGNVNITYSPALFFITFFEVAVDPDHFVTDTCAIANFNNL